MRAQACVQPRGSALQPWRRPRDVCPLCVGSAAWMLTAGTSAGGAAALAVTRAWSRRREVTDIHRLQRFVDAQSEAFEEVRSELRAGRKTGHWIWFIFPQFDGLGYSATARQFAISSREEAAAYAAHPILGPRLRDSTSLVNAIAGRRIRQILGTPDDLKCRSST